jgi:CRISPR-associated protein Cmr2
MYWKLKLKAILHDPPYKAVSIKEHEKKAQELFDKVLQTTFTDDELNRVIIADKLSSAQSRIIVKPQFQDEQKEKEFENASQVNYNECQFIDIFSERKEPIQSPNEKEVKELFEKLKNLTFSTPEERAKFIFFFLWRFYPEIFPEINKHPADSRAPNHSIYDHLVQTSAIVSALPNPAFLLFTIGPVQSFISKARKTSDLWSGSYMLSYLIWESMKILVEDEELGPDVIIFPNLFGQPLVDRWLYFEIFKNSPFANFNEPRFKEWFEKWRIYEKENKSDDEKDLARKLEEKLTIANLPNRFLAVIPYDKNLAERCENSFRKKLENLAEKVYKKVCFYIFLHNLYELKNKGIIIPVPSDDKDLFEEGLERAFIESLGNSNPNTIFNFLSEWKFEVEKIMEFVNSEFSEVLKLGNKLVPMIIKHLSSYFQVYWVIMPWVSNSNNNYSPDDALNDYKELFSENEIYKTIKEIVNHPYYKPANVGSAYSLLLELTEKLLGATKSVRDFEVLEQPGEKCHLCGEFEVLDIDWISLNKGRPGTLRGRLIKIDNKEVWEGEKLCGVCLTKRLFPEIIKDELNLSHEIKFPSTSEMASIGEKRRLNKEIKEDFKQKFNELIDIIKRKNNNKDLPPSISVPKLKGDLLYYIDGQFLMKETYRKEYFEKEYGIQNISESDFQDILKVLDQINPSKYYAILQMDGDNMGKWLKGEFNPKIKDTLHAKVKDALIQFSEGKDKESLQKILCSRHPTSPSIHQAFSRKLSQFALEEVRKIVEDEHYGKLIYAGGDDVLAFLPIEEVLKCAYDLQKKFKEVLSPKASMSAGIVIIHHKYPLYLALEEVNNAEKRAKKHYGKNAFCLRFLSHGGEPRECGGNWELISFLEDLICKFKTDEISSVFPYQYLEVVEKLCERDKNKNIQNIKEILESELKRIFMKKEGDKERLEDYFEKEILSRFKKIEDFEDFANMLVIARKISGEVRV